jgi:hypothetical protein
MLLDPDPLRLWLRSGYNNISDNPSVVAFAYAQLRALYTLSLSLFWGRLTDASPPYETRYICSWSPRGERKRHALALPHSFAARGVLRESAEQLEPWTLLGVGALPVGAEGRFNQERARHPRGPLGFSTLAGWAVRINVSPPALTVDRILTAARWDRNVFLASKSICMGSFEDPNCRW